MFMLMQITVKWTYVYVAFSLGSRSLGDSRKYPYYTTDGF